MAARGLNKVMIIGYLGADPELRTTPGGKAVATFRVAVNRTTTGVDGERGEATEWVRVVAWEKLAETCGQYLRKGNRVYVEGRLQTRSWDGTDGQKHYLTEVVAGDMLMLDGSHPKDAALVPQRDWTPVEDATGLAEEAPF